MRLLLLALLTGCGSTPERVEIPVAVPCVKTAPAEPTIYTDAELAAMNDGQFTEAIWLDRKGLIRYAKGAGEVIANCAKLKPQ